MPVARPRDRGISSRASLAVRDGGNSLSFSRALCRCDTRKQHVSRMNSHGGLARVLSFPLWLPGGRTYPPSRSPLSCPSPAFTARSSLYLSPSRRVFLEHSKNHDGTRCRFLSRLSARRTAASSSASPPCLSYVASLALPRSLREH